MTNLKQVFTLFLIFFFAQLTLAHTLPELQTQITKISDKVIPSIVAISGIKEETIKKKTNGSGIIIRKDGYILTNLHVVDKLKELKVRLKDKREFAIKIIGTDPQTDLAVIKIEASDLALTALADSDKLKAGNLVIAVGNPHGLLGTMSLGTISNLHLSNLGVLEYEDFIQTDAVISSGSSGGALVNLDGEVIGITSAIWSNKGNYQGISFAIPVNMAMKIADQLIANGKVTRGWLGVIAEEPLNSNYKTGVRVGELADNSPAKQAGILRGDIILKFDGQDISNKTQLKNIVALAEVGKTVPIQIKRLGKTQLINVKIGTLPD